MENSGEPIQKDLNVEILNEMKKYISKISIQTKQFMKHVIIARKQSENYEKELNNNINNLITFINAYKNNSNEKDLEIKQKYFENLKNQFKNYYENIYMIYENNYINDIKKNNGELNELLNQIIIDFNPPKINSFDTFQPKINIGTFNSSNEYDNQEYRSHSIIKGYISYVEDEIENNNNTCISKNENEVKNNNNNFCFYCKKPDSELFCKKCNIFICEKCLEKNKENHKKDEHPIIKINEEERKFLDSLIYIIKNILMKANILLINKDIKKKPFNFPYIKQKNNSNSEINYLIDINEILEKELGNYEIKTEDFKISEMQTVIIKVIKTIFSDKNIDLLKDAFDNMEDNSSDDDNYIQESAQNKDYEKATKEFDKRKNMIYYSLNLIPNNNFQFNEQDILEVFLNKIKEKIEIEDYNIILSFGNKNSFINNFIKTKKFYDFKYKHIKNSYSGFEKLYEYKLIFDNILKDKNYLDYRGNTISPNSSYNLMRGTEKYYPPYGWFGLGLNVLKKYENDEWLENKTNSSKWAIAYHGVGQKLSSENIKELLNKIVKENKLIQGDTQLKAHSKDIRHPGKKIGVGVYLTPDINIAEKFSGIIYFNKKKYKVVIMARVLINKIKEPEDIKFWILIPKYIRIYRILLKEEN